MENFFERHQSPKLTQDEIENLNRSITKKKIRCVIIKVTTKENTDLKAFLVNSSSNIKGIGVTTLQALQKTEEEGILSNALPEDRSYQNQTHRIKRKQQTDNSGKQMQKSSTKSLANNPETHKKDDAP